MKVLGIHLQKGYVRHAVLDGTKENPNYVAGGRTPTPSPADIPALMDWFDTKFRQLITDHSPERISYRLPLNLNKEQLLYLIYPFGVLNLLAFQHAIPISNYTPRSFVASKVGRPKGTDVYDMCDEVLGDHPPYWDNHQKNAALVAWFKV